MSEIIIPDISAWQGANYQDSPGDSLIDYDKLAAMSPHGVILRASRGSYKDLRFEQNYAELTARGVPLAAYHFFVPVVTVSMQAATFNLAVSGKVFDLPYFSRVLDVEAPASGWSQLAYRDAVLLMQAYCMFDCVYTRATFWDPALGNWWPIDTAAWIAHYGVDQPNEPLASPEYTLHQFSADGNGMGAAYGVRSSAIDLNRANPALVEPPPDPEPEPEPGCEPRAGVIKQDAWLRTGTIVTSTYPPTGTRITVLKAGTAVQVWGELPPAGGYDWLLLGVPGIMRYGVTAAHLVEVQG